ncbi:uncharacterized protein LOC116001635 [Ipomoea triloba]|uniref:uncharacterized protein LOC116001635 n=1 Tax=Ipomoea triloba TaxID=35885 RepID=UPI00125DBD7D|nr:uncharacterized protein LOC116001635 [Ipomoea triloba]
MGNIPTLPIDATFKFPSPLPTWPSGGGFGSGYIDLGGLQVCQISNFKKIWTTYEGGPNNVGATIFEPSLIPDGFSMLGSYAQPNNQPLFGWVLVGKDNNNGEILKPPTDYTLVWSSESLPITQSAHAYIWSPVPPPGYAAVGHVVTTSPEKPSGERIRCVFSGFTDQCEVEDWVWGQGKSSDSNGFNLYTIRPSNRGTEAKGVNIGAFVGSFGENNVGTFACLKNNSLISSYSMPNLSQIEALFREYSPVLYLHPLETYHPSSVNWFFSNGALLYTKGQETNPVRIEPGGSNLPQGGSNDGLYWINLPVDSNEKERVKKGDLQSSEVYLNIKPMFGGTFTDIAIWIFYPFNGPSTAKLGQIEIIPLGIIGEHVGDWEHLTLRISNFNGVLNKLYLSEHSGGSWVNSPNLEFFNGTNKPVAYSSLNGHANYPKPGLVLQGIGDFIGIRNDTAKSAAVLDTGLRFSVVVEAAWVMYCREWGPKITYISGEDIKRVESLLPVEWRGVFEALINLLPNEFFGEEGPTGPNMKASWSGDEK